MTAVLLGLLVAGIGSLLAFGVVWARWAVRTARRRRQRLAVRAAQRGDLERAERQLRLRVAVRP